MISLDEVFAFLFDLEHMELSLFISQCYLRLIETNDNKNI